jgi:hypothetical protein
VTVLIGSNDTMRRRYRAALPHAYALLLARLPPGTVIGTLGSAHQVAAEVSDLITGSARQRGLIVADMRGGGPASWRGRLAEDHFHPNDVGYAAAARVFAGALDGHRQLGQPRVKPLDRGR